MEERTQCLGCGGLPFRTAVGPESRSRGLGDTAVPGPEEVRGICLRWVVLNYRLTVVPDRRYGRRMPILPGGPLVVEIRSDACPLFSDDRPGAAATDLRSVAGPECLALQLERLSIIVTAN